jgi:hypothetical protein
MLSTSKVVAASRAGARRIKQLELSLKRCHYSPKIKKSHSKSQQSYRIEARPFFQSIKAYNMEMD